MTMFGSQWLGNAGSTYEIEQSIRFNDDDTPYLQRTPGSAGNDHTWTVSFWVKRGSDISDTNQQNGIVGAGDGADMGGDVSRYDSIGFYNDTFQIFTFGGSSPYTDLRSTVLFRDPSSWYHFVVRYDDTQSTATNRVRLYVNGVQVTTFSPANYPDQNSGTNFNTALLQRVGANTISTSRNIDGYLAEIVMIDGTSLGPDSFGETNSTTGQWVPIDVSDLTYGTNGFRLKGQDSSALGDDTSGEGNDFASSGLAANDQMSDSPTNSHCTWNSLTPWLVNMVLSNGNTAATCSERGNVGGTIAVTSGKWYWETKMVNANSGGSRHRAGIIDVDNYDLTTESFYFSYSAYGWSFSEDGKKENNNTNATYGNTFNTANDVIGVALDMDNGAIYFSINDTWQNSATAAEIAAGTTTNAAFTGLSGKMVPAYGDFSGNAVGLFAEDVWAGTAPSGFKALNTTNLPAPAIEYPPDYFTPYIYTGDDSGTSRAFTGVGFAPNLVWTKARGATYSHALFDTVRGVEKYLSSDGTGAEINQPSSGYITAFGSDGYTFSDGSSNRNNYNADTTYVSWNWAEGSTPGFDIVSYTGNATARTISHNLGVVPEMMIVKNRADTDNWAVYHAGNTSAPETDYLVLNDYAATADDATVWNDTAPTSSVFSVGTSSLTNGNTEAMIAYVFAPVEGFSKFGSYTGNGSSSGPMINFGFRPAWYLVKLASGINQSWYLFDDQRDPFNFVRRYLGPNRNNAEVAGVEADISHDFLSNGIKIRTDNAFANTSGAEYVYAAFAKTPFKTANAR